MGLKIKRLYIKNFKVFEEIDIDFENSKLTVLDGPNGFGKTTIYDAIELLFTGTIRRYESLNNLILDKREKLGEIPFYCNNPIGKDIEIKAEVECCELNNKSQVKIFIRRVENVDKLEISDNKIDFSIFKFYTAESYKSESSEYEEPEDSNFLEKILGESYKENFEFLNYVEQEESCYLLKHKDKERKNSIQHLFNTKEFEKNIKKIDDIKKRGTSLKNQLVAKQKQLESEISKIKSRIVDELEGESKYKKLISINEFPWDKEVIDFKTYSFSSILEENGELLKVEDLVLNLETFEINRANNIINTIIKEKRSILNMFLKYDKYYKNKDSVLKELELIKEVNNFIKSISKIDNKRILDKHFDLPQIVENRFSNNKLFDLYITNLEEVKNKIKTSDNISKLSSDLIVTRNTFVENFKKYSDKDDTEYLYCPLCGSNLESQNILFEQIEIQSKALEKSSKKLKDSLAHDINRFNDKVVKELIDYLKSYLNNSDYNEEYFKEFYDIDINQIDKVKDYLNSIKIEYLDIINLDTNPESPIKIELLINRLKEKILDIDTTKLKNHFSTTFASVFNNNIEELKKLDHNMILNKKRYINNQFRLFQNNLLNSTKKNLEIIKKKLDIIDVKYKKINQIVQCYKESLKSYNIKVIKDIELLFHIYTGRILLNYQGGLGLFIKNEKDGLKFVTDPSRNVDALFCMSSGQLSALIISFTLALNKIYSRNKVVFIDDPVQTMDEINITGFIELLRNEFADRQIFISTHEAMMSTYMRYKFEKYNLKTNRIDVKNISNKPQNKD